MKQILKKLPFLLLVLLHVLFLLAILLEKLNFISILIFVVAALMLMVIAYTKVPTQDNAQLYKDYGAIVFVVLGAGLSYYINVNAGFGPVIATGAVGTFASMLPWLNRNSALLKEAPAAAYCGSFVGMSSPNVAGNILFILFAGFVAGVLLVFSKNIFHGYGGKLGTIAFGGVALTYLVVFLFFR